MAKTTTRPAELKSVLVKMPKQIKTPLVAEAIEKGSSLNDVAVGILAERLHFAFHPSDRNPASKPNPGIEDVVLRIPETGKRKIQSAALKAELNMTDYVNSQLADYLGVEWGPPGRKRVPFGGGSRAAAAST